MFFPSTKVLPKVVDFKANFTLVQLESGAVVMIGEVKALPCKEGDNQTYLVELLHPVTQDLLIAVRLHKDGGLSTSTNMLNAGELQLGITKVIDTPRIKNAFTLKADDEVLLDTGESATVIGISEPKYNPTVRNIHLNNGTNIAVLQNGQGIHNSTSILTVKVAPDYDDNEDD